MQGFVLEACQEGDSWGSWDQRRAFLQEQPRHRALQGYRREPHSLGCEARSVGQDLPACFSQ